MEFERSADGTLTPLPAPSIDTGMGLERITAVLQQKDSNYDTDLFTPLLHRDRRARRTYGTAHDEQRDVSMRVVADHIRATTFLIADGVIPSNEWRGYVLRKIMRRAMRHGKHLGLTEPFLHRLVAVLDREMGDAYPELRTQPRDDREDDPRRREPLRRGADRRPAAARGGDRQGRSRRPNACCRATRRSSSTTRSACRTTSSRTPPRRRTSRSIAPAFERAMEGQRDKARAKSAFEGGDEGRVSSSTAIARRSRRRRRVSKATRRRPRVGRADCSRCSTTHASRSTDCSSRPDGLRRAARNAVLPRGRRPGVRHRPHRQRSDGRVAVVDGMRRIASQDLPRAHHVRVDARAASRRATSSPPRSTPTSATPRGAITRRRTCCTRRCARCSARTSSRPARSSRPIACASTSCTSSRSRATSSIASSASSTSRLSATRR